LSLISHAGPTIFIAMFVSIEIFFVVNF